MKVPAFSSVLTAIAVAALGASPAVAQTSGEITYTHTVKLEFDLPPEMAAFRDRMPESRERTMLVRFTAEASNTTLERGRERGGPAAGRVEFRRRGGGGDIVVRGSDRRVSIELGALEAMRGGGPAGGGAANMGVVLNTFRSFETGKIIETRDLLGRKFRIPAEAADIDWRMTAEQAIHEGHMVIKATADVDGSVVEAWFTPAIPVQGGPGAYGGLPGMILVLNIDEGREQYFATEIKLGEVAEGSVTPPEDGEEMSLEDFTKIAEEKAEELRSTRRRGRG